MSGVTSVDGDGNSEMGDLAPTASHQPGARKRKGSNVGTSGTSTATSTGDNASSAAATAATTGSKVAFTDKFTLEAMAVAGTKRGRR